MASNLCWTDSLTNLGNVGVRGRLLGHARLIKNKALIWGCARAYANYTRPRMKPFVHGKDLATRHLEAANRETDSVHPHATGHGFSVLTLY